MNIYLVPSLRLEYKYRVANKIGQTELAHSKDSSEPQPIISVLDAWRDRALTIAEKPLKTITVLSIGLNSIENYTPAPDELIKNLIHTQIFCKYFDLVHFLICNFILIRTSQHFILFNKYFKYVNVLHCSKCFYKYRVGKSRLIINIIIVNK